MAYRRRSSFRKFRGRRSGSRRFYKSFGMRRRGRSPIRRRKIGYRM